MEKLNAVIDAWADTSREMVLSARKVIDDVLCVRAEECFAMGEWVEILESDGGRFEDGEKVGWVMDSVRRGLSERSAGIAYQVRFLLPIILAVPLMALQVIVSSILPRPHTTDTDATMLSSTSTIRIKSRKRKWIFPNGYANDGWVLDRKAGSSP